MLIPPPPQGNAGLHHLDSMAMIEAAMTQPPFPDSETRYRSLVEQLPAVTYIASLGPGLPATYVSPQIAEYGFAPETWLADPAFWMKRLHADDRERVLAEFARGIAAGGPINCEYRLLDAAGRPRWVKDRASVLRDAAGRAVAIQGVMIDIGERKQIEGVAAQHQAQLHALRRRMETAIEDERRRMAREVHDELGQALTALRLELALLGEGLPADPAVAARIAAMDALIGRTVDSVRRIAYELRPGVLDSLGLLAAIEWQTREFERRSGIRCELALPEREPEVEPARATALFRIFQEILTNIARHAGATQVDVGVTAAVGNLLIEVDDDGRGFDPASPEAAASLGLLGMRERAAEFGGLVGIHSEPGRGTRITLALPMIPSQ